MTAFTSIDNIIQALSINNRQQDLTFSKTLAQATIARIPHTLWTGTGFPVAGSFPVTSTTATLCTSSTTGAFNYNNSTGGRTMHAMSLTSCCFGSNGVLVLVDRIASCTLNASTHVGTTSLTSMDATTRLGSTEGARVWIEVASNLGASAISLTLTYTNSAGTGSRTTTITGTASAVAGRSLNANMFQNLATDDNGVRSIQSYAIPSGTTGTICINLVRPICVLPIPATSIASTKDLIMEMPNLPQIYDSSCLHFIWLPNTTTQTTFSGLVRIGEN